MPPDYPPCRDEHGRLGWAATVWVWPLAAACDGAPIVTGCGEVPKFTKVSRDLRYDHPPRVTSWPDREDLPPDDGLAGEDADREPVRPDVGPGGAGAARALDQDS